MFDKVLIIEDATSIALPLREMLFNDYQLNSDIAGSLTEARELIKKNKDEYFVASVDLQLPDGKTGAALDLVHDADIPAIVFTGQKDPSIRENFESHLLVDYVFKDSARSLNYISWLCHRVLHNKELVILIVDDSPSALATLKKLVENQGFQILTATSREEALKTFKEHEEIDIVILDQFLSDSMGYELCSEIRNLRPNDNIQILGVSSKGGKDDAALFLKSGGDDFLLRPFNPEEFIHRVNHKADYIEQILEMQHRSEEKNKFWGMAIHDLRNPLGVIFQVVKRLNKSDVTPEKAATLAEMMSKSADTLQHLLDDLLNISALESGRLALHPTTFNLSDLVTEQVSFQQAAANDKNIILKSNLPDSAMVEADPTRIIQVIDNLLSNALKYSPQGSTIEVAIEKQEHAIHFRVTDQGEGIKDKDISKLFKAFIRLGHKTTGGESSHGIGLSICKRIMDSHKGRIGYEHNPDGGSVFYFELPKH